MTIQNQEPALNANVQDFVHFMTTDTSGIPDVLVGKMAIEKFGRLNRAEVAAGIAAAEGVIAERAAKLEKDKAALGDNGVLLEMCKPTLAAAPQWLDWFADALQTGVTAGVEAEARIGGIRYDDVGDDDLIDVSLSLSDWRMAISNLRKLKFAIEVSNGSAVAVPA
jgi:hypothetical protein